MIDGIEHVAENLVRVTKRSMLSGVMHSMELPIRSGQLHRWMDGALIQDAMPNLNAEQREFLITGITPSEWNEAFG